MRTYWTRVFDRGSSRNETIQVMLNILLKRTKTNLTNVVGFFVRIKCKYFDVDDELS
jgi:hypothetical protein